MTQSDNNGSIHPYDLLPDEVIFGLSPKMAMVRSKVQLAAATDVPVLLQGDSGTGKEILARLVHLRSNRAARPWVKVMCPAVSNSLIESELFGYEKGPRIGASSTKRGRVELAHNSTLFLDEIGGLDPSVQAKLVQLLEEGLFMRVGGEIIQRIDARIVSSANVNLKKLVDGGSLRIDLLYRLNAVTIDLPRLQERIEDLPLLVGYFLNKYSRSLRRAPKPLSSKTMSLMRRFHWPGNIRQLENLIRGYVLTGDEEVIRTELTPPGFEFPIPEMDLSSPVSLKQIINDASEKLERGIIFKVLDGNGGNRRKAAQWLKISYRSLLYKLGEAYSADY